VLKEGDALDPRPPPVTVGGQQDGGRKEDKRKAQSESFDDVLHRRIPAVP
jgi:hypothetical protein